jgi:hypothetical protein
VSSASGGAWRVIAGILAELAFVGLLALVGLLASLLFSLG